MGRELSFYIEGNKKTKMKVASLLALAPYVLEFRNPRTNECTQYGK